MRYLGLLMLWLAIVVGVMLWAHAPSAGAAQEQRATPTAIPRQATPTPKCDTFGLALGMDSEEAELWRLINDYRETNGRPRLVWTPSLEKAALWQANDMSLRPNVVLDHNDRTGRGPFGRMPDCGYLASPIMGENLSAGYTSASGVFNGWKGSPGHNYVMLLADFRVGGLARVYQAGSYYGWYYTLDVGGAAEGPGVYAESRWGWVCPGDVCERVR